VPNTATDTLSKNAVNNKSKSSNGELLIKVAPNLDITAPKDEARYMIFCQSKGKMPSETMNIN